MTDTWFRFLIKRTRIEKPSYGPEKDYDWLKFNIFTRWIPSSEETIIIAFDIAPDIKNRLLQLLFNAINSESRSNPYLYHMVIAEEVLSLQSEAVWNIRTKVRHVEQTRTAPSPNYNRLHELARHAIHVVETLDLAERTFHSMITHHEQFTAGTTKPKRFQHFIDDRLCFYKEGVQSLRLRSIANKDRLLNEIQCSFNFVAQNIASTSMETNQSLQSDSSAMKSIMLLTSAFVPLTYIATLFSMSFFSLNTESGRWLMSDRFWLYWVVSVPFTVAAAFLSYLYHSRFILQKAKHS